jgi:hypothetical protein
VTKITLKTFNSEIDIRLFYYLILAFFVVSYTLGYLYMGDGCHYNHATYFYSLGICTVLALGVRVLKGNRLSEILALGVGFNVILYYLFRLFIYLIAVPQNKKLLYVMFPTKWSYKEINEGLSYTLLSLFCSYLGIYIGSKILKNAKPLYQYFSDIRDLRPFATPALFALFITTIVQSYYFIYLGLSASTNCTYIDVPYKWVIHFFSADIATCIVLSFFSYLYLRYKDKKYLYTIFIVGVLFWIFTLFLGSRGGILRLVFFAFYIWIFYAETLKIKLGKILLVCFGFVIFSALSFKVGTKIREIGYKKCSKVTDSSIIVETKKTKSEPSLSDVGVTQIKTHYANNISCEQVKESSNNIHLPQFLATIFDRLGLIDYTVGISVLSPKGDQKIRNHYFSYKYAFKSFINNIVPGSPFPEVEMMSSNTMPLVFRAKSLDYIKKNFNSDLLMVWGSAYMYNGYWGGAFACVLWSIAIILSFVIFKLFGLGFYVIFLPSWFWVCVIGMFFMNSYDYYLTIVAFYGIEVASFSFITFICFNMFKFIKKLRI